MLSLFIREAAEYHGQGLIQSRSTGQSTKNKWLWGARS